MFISEVGEANYCGLKNVDQEIVDESNTVFSDLMGKVINEPILEIYKYVDAEYGKLIKYNPVAEYNHQRLYYAN